MGDHVTIIGAGLAGSEAALVLARAGIKVTLYESRPFYKSPAHETDYPAELVCSNSLKSDKLPSAHGLLKSELKLLNSPLINHAYEVSIPAGSALAVDRLKFSQTVEKTLLAQEKITFIRKEIDKIDFDSITLCAAGPLISEKLSAWLMNEFGVERLNFYDAIAPIIAADSIDYDKAFFASRWEEDGQDYCNCPFTKEEYDDFVIALRNADKTSARAFEDQKYFEACLPVEEIASRGDEALCFGPLRPVGLKDPKTGKRPYAVCQLRRENATADAFNMVGFQTRLTISAQKEIFRIIPGLENAEFYRYGSIHRNTYLDSPKLLSQNLSFKKHPHIFIAGQLSGGEGYTESIATGHLSALFILATLKNRNLNPPPRETALGSLHAHITSSGDDPFTPSNIQFGLFPPLELGRKKIGKNEKKELYCKRALEQLNNWIETV